MSTPALSFYKINFPQKLPLMYVFFFFITHFLADATYTPERLIVRKIWYTNDFSIKIQNNCQNEVKFRPETRHRADVGEDSESSHLMESGPVPPQKHQGAQ
ncbi:hypothetical protein NL108_016178 [Boleophthalmus pectinirostris]|nr:hypothetical protein NL108_016178 [Boleophthalmus pectinirostris]